MQDTTLQWTSKNLWRLAWPLAVELLLAVAIGMADTVMVTSVSEAAVSGISLVDSINNLLITLISALATGGSVIISQFLGMRDSKNASTAAKQLIYSVTLTTILLMLFTLVFRRGLLQLIYGHIEGDVMSAAETYFLLTAVSYPFLGLYNAGSAIFRSMGNSRVSMVISISMNLINIGGNAILIFIFGWGVAGAGTATLVSRIVGAALITMLASRLEGALNLSDIKKIALDLPIIKSILRIGVPNGLENSMFQVGKLLVARIISTFGTAAIAGNAIANSILNFGNVPGQAIGLVLLTVIGQSVGAARFDVARKLNRKLLQLCHILMFSMALVLFIIKNPLLAVFNLSPQAYEIAEQCCMVYIICVTIFWPPSFALPNSLRAAGDVSYTMVVSVLSMWIFRIGFSYLLAIQFEMGVVGVWIAMVIDWVFRGAAFLLRWRSKAWETKRIVHKN